MPFKNQHPLYSTWQAMRRRCLTPSTRYFGDYGGRGISICERWNDFHTFAADMGPKPSPKHSLDRIDNNGNYEPTNCRWATRQQQQTNQRVTRMVRIGEWTYIAAVLAKLHGLKTDTIVKRASRGLSYAEVTAPEKRYNLDGLSLGGLANGARNRAKTHCKHGHPFDEKNTYIHARGRTCRACCAARMRRVNAQKRAAASQ